MAVLKRLCFDTHCSDLPWDNYYTKTEIRDLIASLGHVTILIVSELPATGEPNVIYFVPKVDNPNVYEEYMYISGAWEQIGDTGIDVNTLVDRSTYNANMRTIAAVDNDQCSRIATLEQCCEDMQAHFFVDADGAHVLSDNGSTRTEVIFNSSGQVIFKKGTREVLELISGDEETYAQVLGNFYVGNKQFPEFSVKNSYGDVARTYAKRMQADNYQHGRTAGINVPANSYRDINITFPYAYWLEDETPHVVCSLFSSSDAPTIGNITVANAGYIYNSDDDPQECMGFTARIFNASNAQRTPAVEWIAIS